MSSIASITAAVTGIWTLAKTIRRTAGHALAEVFRGNLKRRKYKGFEEKHEQERKVKDRGPDDDGYRACSDE